MMKYKLQRKQSNPLDMRLFNLKTEKVMGYIWGWKEHGMTIFRATVTFKGLVHGHDTYDAKVACRWILDKRKELNIGDNNEEL